MAEPVCKALAKNGQPCKSTSTLPDSQFCYFHDPRWTPGHHAKNSAKGGSTPRSQTYVADSPKSPIQLARILSGLIAHTLATSDPSANILKAVAALSSELRESWRDARKLSLEKVGDQVPQPQAKVYVLQELSPKSVSPSLQGEGVGSKTGALPPKTDAVG